MKSHEDNNHGAADQHTSQAKKPWVAPSLQVIALESAEGGTNLRSADGTSAHTSRPRS
jgi:hypothetical protein